jgi:ABC-type polysaccharide/polyol phosphate export permease
MATNSVQALWRRRDLALTLASSEFKSRYRRLGLGVLWAVINPLVQSIVIAIVFSRLRGDTKLGDIPFVLYVMAGMMPWTFFANTLLGGTSTLTDSGQIIQRVSLPRASLPTATMLVNIYNFAFVLLTLVVMVAIMAWSHMGNAWMLPAVVLVQIGLMYGMILLTSSLQVRYRDVGQLVGAALLVWFWITPIVYPMDFVAGHPLVRAIIRANPLTGIVSAYRFALLDFPLDRVAALWSLGWTAFFLVVGWVVFRSREDTLADFL